MYRLPRKINPISNVNTNKGSRSTDKDTPTRDENGDISTAIITISNASKDITTTNIGDTSSTMVTIRNTHIDITAVHLDTDIFIVIIAVNPKHISRQGGDEFCAGNISIFWMIMTLDF